MSETVLVTGSSTGFGRRTTQRLIEAGYTVFATMREPEGRNAPRADELTAFAEGKPGALHLLELDVAHDASVDSTVARALQLEDRIDVVIVEPGGFKTSFLSNMEMAEDDARVASYGALAEISEKMWDGFTETLQGDEAPDAQRVADAILGVIQTPRGNARCARSWTRSWGAARLRRSIARRTRFRRNSCADWRWTTWRS